ncbi:MDR family MFS transporter [Marinactinospora thermotolerans]|uniref:Drug resistance transporter, EmrB/QacA subfamily n=1 Tax=Marinactinospora thermotolerans DSM 45154 TaxID=1122192 RepID=A0A1T4PQ37_9ACTN|nr:MDR family MFS transporter [Marinactinospora thermotolerans]SJZ93529.1 drug resistance transporter, EmrB/QacA subfamily [Marinactinospora thermotolerans DSM 45154]
MSAPTTVHKDGPAAEPADRRTIYAVFAALMVAMLLGSLDQTILSTALPTIVGELGGVNHMLWVTTAYILAATITMPVYGKLGDLVGRKNLFILSLLLFLAGSVIGGAASGMTGLIAGRAVQGLGGGGLMILSQAIIADIIPARERGRYMGVMGSVFAVSSVLGPILGGWFTEGIGWRWAFWINIPLGALAVLAAVVFLRPSPAPEERPRLDVAGLVTMAIAVTSVVLFTSWGGTEYEWDSPVIIGLGVAFVVAGAAFVLVERRAAEPIIPLHLFADRNFNLSTIAGLFIALAMFGAVGYLPTYLQMVSGLDATNAGFLMLPMMAAVLITSTGSGFLVSATGRYKWLPIVGMLVVTGGLLLMSTMTVDTSLPVICLYLAVVGAGIGMGMQILVLVVQNAFPASEVGTATAANNFFREIGASLGSAVVGALFTSRLTSLLGGHGEAVSVGGAHGAVDQNSLTPAAVNAMDAPVKEFIVSSYNEALTPVFLYIAPLMVLSAVILCFIKEKPLATTVGSRTEPADESEPATAEQS